MIDMDRIGRDLAADPEFRIAFPPPKRRWYGPVRTIEGPFGTVYVDAGVPRKPCVRCHFVMVPIGKVTGLCHGCSRPCDLWMPSAKQHCARGAGHRGGCRTRETMDAEAESKSARGARAYVERMG